MHIKDLKYFISIGVSEAERANMQEVSITIEMSFQSTLQACFTDCIEDTVCYSSIEKKLAELFKDREFKTIEYLAQESLNCLVHSCPPNTGIKVRVHKLYPPLGRSNGGVIIELP